jgi:hypothetical protein
MVIPYRNWLGCAYLSLAMAGLSLFWTVTTMPESPRFLYSKKKFDECEKILNNIVKVNKI